MGVSRCAPSLKVDAKSHPSIWNYHQAWGSDQSWWFWSDFASSEWWSLHLRILAPKWAALTLTLCTQHCVPVSHLRVPHQNSTSTCFSTVFQVSSCLTHLLMARTVLLEVKCPFNGRDSQIKPGKFFPFLQQDVGGVVLKKTHKYYYQIIGQLTLSHCKICHFVVFTHVNLLVLEIPHSPQFFEEKMLPDLETFYANHYHVASKL